ncbi:MAG: hypothetical protein WCI88_16580 [Chloroflexota bacterium]|jgi:hypothetical protein
MRDAFESKYFDVLQNIEFAIVSVSREQPDLADYDVEKVLNMLISEYQKEPGNSIVRQTQLKNSVEQLYEGVKGMCDFRLGIVTLETVDGDSIAFPPEPGNSVDEIIACLKRIRKSVQMWNKRGGRRGYLQFVDQFIP